MPAPIRPAPTTPSFSTSRGLGALRVAGVLLDLLRGEEHRDQRARDVRDGQLAEVLRLDLEPLLERASRCPARPRRSRAAAPGSGRRVFSITDARALRKISGRSSRSWSGMPAAARLQRAVGQRERGAARGRGSRTGAGTTSSTRPALSARAALSVRPVRIRSRAAGRPTRRGRRCVPPAPGISPSLTSGRPSTVFGIVASRCGSGRPAPSRGRRPGRSRGWPPPPGSGSASSRSRIAWPAARERLALQRAADGAEVRMSAPAMKLSGLPLREHDRASRRVRDSSSPSSAVQLLHQRAAERVDLLAGHVERERPARRRRRSSRELADARSRRRDAARRAARRSRRAS